MRSRIFGVMLALVLFLPLGAYAGVSRDANNWTVFTPSSDTRTIYVSSSAGSDTNDGLSEAKPVKTINKAIALVRQGFPDWILLKKGDVWKDESFGFQNKLQGRSASEPMLISSYPRDVAGSRPLIKVGPANQVGIGTCCGTIGSNYIAITGLDFYAYQRDPNSPDYVATTTGGVGGFSYLLKIDWMLFEDNKFSFFTGNAFQSYAAPEQNITFRRNVLAYDYSATSHGMGIFTSKIQNLLLEENVFDHNGWNEQVPGAGSTIFNRSVYLSHYDGSAIYRGNIDANGASGGVQMRHGGTAENNLFLQSPISIVFGSSQNDARNIGGVIRNNVTLGSRNIDTQPQGSAIWLSSNATLEGISGSSLIDGLDVYNNIVAHQVFGTTNIVAIRMEGSGPYKNTNIHDNIIYNWSRPSWANASDHRAYGFTVGILASSTNVFFQNNTIQQPNSGFVGLTSNYGPKALGIKFQNNKYWSAEADPPVVWSKGWFDFNNAISSNLWFASTTDTGSVKQQVSFPDPNRTIDTYMISIGMSGGYAAFMARADLQSKDNWDPRFTAAAVNDYIRAGFGLPPVGGVYGTIPPPPPPSPPPTAPTPTPTPTPIPTPTPTPSPTPSPTPAPTPSPTPPPASNLPQKDVLRTIKVAVDLNPDLTCTSLFYIAKDQAKCDEYKNNIATYNWNPVDYEVILQPMNVNPTSPTYTPANSITPTSPTSPSKITISRNLSFGSRGEDVMTLQQFLIGKSLLANGNNSGYFGNLTMAAVKQYQCSVNIVCAGDSNSSGYGVAGPKTRQALNGGEVVPNSYAPSASTGTYVAPTSYAPAVQTVSSYSVCLAVPGDGLMHNLGPGMCTTEITTLQQILNKLGYMVAQSGSGSPGHEGMQYGPATAAAVAKFQKANSITADPVGVVGKATRELLMEKSGMKKSVLL